MRTSRALMVILACALLVAVAGASCGSADSVPPMWGPQESWLIPGEEQFGSAEFVMVVDNPYFPLPPGARWVYEAETGDGVERIEVTVLEETKIVDGVQCTIVRDTVSIDGEVIEDTYDWYAQDIEGNVWYMGEDSKEYEGGQVVSTGGSWEAGVDGALPGIKVWAEPHVDGAPYYQEYFAGEAEDLGRDLRTDGAASVAAGDYSDLLVVEEWNPLSPDVIELKYYAAGVGTVKEETTRGGSEVVELVESSMP